MATGYIVLSESRPDGVMGPNGQPAALYGVFAEIPEARSAEHACRLAAEQVASDKDLDQGVTLIAVPARNWTSGRHTLKAETQRRIRSA